MRVLFVNENIGGHRTVHLHLERALVEAHPGVRADFFHLPPPRLARRLVGASVPGLARLDVDLQPLRAQLAQSALVDRMLRRRADRYDVVHVYTHNAVLLSVATLRRHPVVVSLDTTNVLNAYRIPGRRPTRWTARSLPLVKLFERRVYEAADAVVSQSEWAARSLRADYGVPDHRIRVIPFGVFAPEVGGDPTRLHHHHLPRVTFVGRGMDRKGGWWLLDTWRRRLRSKCRLTLVTLDRVPPEEGLEVINDIRPGDGRIWEVLGSTAVFAFPTEIDHAPNAVLEAMAAGVPVVAFRTGAMAEMVVDGVTGLLADEGDYATMALCLEHLVDEPAAAARIGGAARARSVERFDARVTTARLVAVLEEAVRHHRRGGRRDSGTDPGHAPCVPPPDGPPSRP